ncbi:hypothetical protein LJC01_01210 [Clostridiaceae bacterium OttesenSCG-928-D20]|nr:hypothetical protein [Clostridiaceae bacterium OttesenSCG-928-D20]
MEKSFSIYHNSKIIGELRLREEGLLSVFEGECENIGELFRLSVYGGGREGYIGVMLPSDDKFSIKKSLTKSEMRDFPKEIEYAARAGQGSLERAIEKRSAAEEGAFQEPFSVNAASELEQLIKAISKVSDNSEDMNNAESRGSGERQENAESFSELKAFNEGDTIWQEQGGILRSIGADGEERVALPFKSGMLPATREYEIREIEGEKYIIFLENNDKI